jgi:hypothetical protein
MLLLGLSRFSRLQLRLWLLLCGVVVVVGLPLLFGVLFLLL